ncbi:MAG: DNA-deoxyinosine glycosylase [Clostridia bacterium]|nr:DNA-deoxyinosine glycosylase [Clostridia bacterium]
MYCQHPFEPVAGPQARILILGSFPSVRSRQEGFYYGHARNRFWQVLAQVYGRPVPGTIPEKKALLAGCRIALWDVAAGCEIEGSADAAIRRVQVNDVPALTVRCPVRAVYCNGATAGRLYRQYLAQAVGLPYTVLPSTSPANAAWSLPRLVQAWQCIRWEGQEKNDETEK